MANRIGHIGADYRSRFQLALAVCLLGFAVTYLFSSLERVTAQAEQQGIRLMLNQFRSALVVKGAEAMLADEKLEPLAGLNPVQLLERPPMNWGGDCQRTNAEPGGWCFHEEKQAVVYFPRSPDARAVITGVDEAGTEPLAWRVEVDYTTPAGNKSPRAVGLKLTRVKSGQINLENYRD